MAGFLLKNTLMRRHKAVDAVFAWMEDHGVNPEEDCFGAPAVNAFVAKLLAQQPKGPYSFVGAKQSKMLGPHGFELHIDDLRAYLWGPEFKVFNLDAEKDTTQDLEAQTAEAAAEAFEEPVPEFEAAAEAEAEFEAQAEPEEAEEPRKSPRRRSKKAKKAEEAKAKGE